MTDLGRLVDTVNPHHAFMQELAAVRQADLLREAKADRDSALADVSKPAPARGRLGGAAAALVFAVLARRDQRVLQLEPGAG